MDNDSSLREAAVASMAEIFLAGARGAADFAAFEDAAIAAGHSMMAEAIPGQLQEKLRCPAGNVRFRYGTRKPARR